MYTPSEDILNKYADLLINYALGGGAGIKPGEVVWARVPETAKPLFAPLRNAILKAGGHPIIQMQPHSVSSKDFYALANDDQLNFFPELYMKGIIDQIDHLIGIEAPYNKYELKDVESKKLMQVQNANYPFMQWRTEKENAGKFTWTLALYGTPALAADADMSEEEYWEQIIVACNLDAEDPKEEWRAIAAEVERVKTKLNELPIESVHITGENIDLQVGIGENRIWLGGGGRNIPSYEIFISPDWRKTEGEISFNQPLFYGGNKISDIYLRFENGVVVESRAGTGEDLLKEMIASPNADKVGEFSLTDGRLSRITQFMGTTLYDENMGGSEGNTHVALGNAYTDSYPGNPSEISKEQWAEMGYNTSPVHTDIISTQQRTVTAKLTSGEEKVIYQNGQFQL